MIDVSEKPFLRRTASASGKIFLKNETRDKIKNKEIKKGDVFETAKIAGINAIKKTPDLIPYCHQIPIEHIDFSFKIDKKSITANCTVKATAKTGVEMEALVGVAIALNTIWDMVKYLEKDEKGQYPNTKITEIKVTKKVKQ